MIVKILTYGRFQKIYEYYKMNKKMVYNILKDVCDVVEIPIMAEAYPNKFFLKDFVLDNSLYIFGELDYNYILYNYCNQKDFRPHIRHFLENADYICYFSEVFENNNMLTIGNNLEDLDFAKLFFGKAKAKILCNYKNIDIVKKHIGDENLYYNPTNGYSEYNYNLITYSQKKDIDVLIYGNGLDQHKYRKDMIKQITDFCQEKGFSLKCGSLWDTEKWKVLDRTKIVIHIPSYPNLETTPWAKIVELQTNKVFFLSENNVEIEKVDKYGVFPIYTDIDDLCKKIEFFLNNDIERQIIIDKNYEFTKNNFNLDELLRGIVLKCLNNHVKPNAEINVEPNVEINVEPNVDNNVCNTYGFLNLYCKQWSSMNFYYLMAKRIQTIFDKHGIPYVEIDDPKLMGDHKDCIFIIDLAVLLTLKIKHQMLPKMLDMKYILIVGENYDKNINTFIGWCEQGLRFEPDNLLYKIFNNALKVTQQNLKTKVALEKFIPKSRIFFFPIDGYLDEYIINEDKEKEKDIDIFIYGGMCYDRRVDFVKRLFMVGRTTVLKIAVFNNIFNLDEMIARSKIIVHINSNNNCYHVPYAKILKPLANNKILFVENVEELESSDLKRFIHTFNYTQNNMEPILTKLANMVNNYGAEQEKIDKLDPKSYIKDNYNFEKFVLDLIKEKIEI